LMTIEGIIVLAMIGITYAKVDDEVESLTNASFKVCIVICAVHSRPITL
jgi:hypothetical protein